MKLVLLILGFLAVSTVAQNRGYYGSRKGNDQSVDWENMKKEHKRVPRDVDTPNAILESIKSIDFNSAVQAFNDIQAQAGTNDFVARNKEIATQVLDGMIEVLKYFKDTGGFETS